MSTVVHGSGETALAISPLLVPRPYEVVDKIAEGPDIVTLRVHPVDGPLPSFVPAQVSMLGAFGVGEAAISISSSMDTTDHHDYTIRRAGPITNALVDTPIGGHITIRGPFGNAWPIDESDTSQLLVVAGGLGIVPLRACLDELSGQIERFDRLALLYGAKTPDDLIFGDDLTRWAADGLEIDRTVDVGAEGWSGSIGLIPDRLAPAPDGGATQGTAPDWEDTTVFVCGPDIMMHFTSLRLVDLGVAPERIWLTLERNMQCGNGLCGHCQLGPFLVCRDGPIVNYADIGPFHRIKEL